MGHEISQFDIPNRQLLATNAQSGVCMWTDIGEAKITHTIFGRAKVRVIREHDKKRRAWLLMTMAVTALATVAWLGWIASQQTEPLVASPLPLSARIRVSAPTFQPEDISFPATTPSARSKQRTPSQIVIDNMTTRRESPPPRGLNAVGKIAAQPVTAQPLIANKPQTAALATNNNASKHQTDMQRLPRLSAPIQPVAPTVATPPGTPPAANRPANLAPLVAPSIKEDTSPPSPAGNNQPPGPVKAQP